MKYMFRLTTFATLCLLVASCHSSPSTPPVSSSAIVRGAIEDGFVKGANCFVTKISHPTIAYSRAIVQDGSYAVKVPREPFSIICIVTSYIPVTGKDDTEIIPEKDHPILLKTSGFVEKAEEATLNINVLTTLVTHQVGDAVDEMPLSQTSDSAFWQANFDQIKQKSITALNTEYGITIGNLDELRLKDLGLLAKFNLAVQKKINDGGLMISKADVDNITPTMVTALNSYAIVQDINFKLTPPAPLTIDIGKHKAIDPTTKPVIDLSADTIPFSISGHSLLVRSENLLTDSVLAYVVNDKIESDPIRLTFDSVKMTYKATDIKDLFDPTSYLTTLTICLFPTPPTPYDVVLCKKSADYDYGYFVTIAK